jgi:hypothetical protein
MQRNAAMMPMVITLCGSTRFERDFHAWNKYLSLTGHVVLSLSVFPSQEAAGRDWCSEAQQSTLLDVHTRKIDISDAIVVLNYEGYCGQLTTAEMHHAYTTGKPIYSIWKASSRQPRSAYTLLEPEFLNYVRW